MAQEKTVWEMLFEALKNEGIKVYPPATKTGECTEPYVVVKESGASEIPGISSQSRYFTVMVYVPKDTYTQLAREKSRTKEVIAEKLYPILFPTGEETPDFYDDTVKAHTTSILYRNSIRNKHL